MSDDASATFPCFGSQCTVHVSGGGALGSPEEAVASARAFLLDAHSRFSRFEPDSELSRLNAAASVGVHVSPLLARLAACVRGAASLTGGLVDATLLEDVRAAGYETDIAEPLTLAEALADAPARHAAGPSEAAAWRQIDVDLSRSLITRPPGVAIDSGGLAKGLFADVLAERLEGHAMFAVDCAGDIAIGGENREPRSVAVESPFDGSVLHTFAVEHGGVATSGIGRRSWRDHDGRPGHHLIDPSTGRPAFTGVVQATALAETALSAETRAKAALLSGPRSAARWLPDGGVIVLDDGSHHVFAPPPRLTMSRTGAVGVPAFAQRGALL